MRLWLWALVLLLAVPAIGVGEFCQAASAAPSPCSLGETHAEPADDCCSSPRADRHDPVPPALADCVTCACGDSCCTENRCGCCKGLPPASPSDPRLPTPRDPTVPEQHFAAGVDAPRLITPTYRAPGRQSGWVMSSDRRRAITAVRLI